MDPFFSILKYITYDKKPYSKLTEVEKKSINPYLLNRYLSMNLKYVEIVNEVQSLNTQDPEKLYKIYLELIPKQQQFLRYMKSNTPKQNKELVDYISKFYKVSLGESADYIKLMDKSQIQDVLQKFGIDVKTQKKLLK